MAKKPPRFVKKGKVYYHVGYQIKMVPGPDGELKQKVTRPYTKLGKDYHKAIIEWGKVEANLNVTSGTFNALAKKYLEDVMPGKAASTQKVQGYQMTLLKKVFGKMQLVDIRPHHIAEYLDTREDKIAANREVQLMSAMYAKAMRWGWVDSNPCAGVERNSEKKRDRYITDAEFSKLRKLADQEMLCFLDIGYCTGLRASDIRNIRRRKPEAEIIQANANKEDKSFAYLDESAGYLFVEHIKTNYKQEFELVGTLKSAVERAKGIKRKVSGQYLLCTRKGDPHSKSGFDSKWRRFREKTGLIDIHFHDIRAKAGTDAKRQGKDYQALLGHTSQGQSDAYVKRRMVERISPLEWIEPTAANEKV